MIKQIPVFIVGAVLGLVIRAAVPRPEPAPAPQTVEPLQEPARAGILFRPKLRYLEAPTTVKEPAPEPALAALQIELGDEAGAEVFRSVNALVNEARASRKPIPGARTNVNLARFPLFEEP